MKALMFFVFLIFIYACNQREVNKKKAREELLLCGLLGNNLNISKTDVVSLTTFCGLRYIDKSYEK